MRAEAAGERVGIDASRRCGARQGFQATCGQIRRRFAEDAQCESDEARGTGGVFGDGLGECVVAGKSGGGAGSEKRET